MFTRKNHQMLTRFATAQPIGDATQTADKTINFVFANPGAVRGDAHQLKPGAWIANWRGMGRDGLTNFRRNPVVLEAHNPAGRAVGKVTSITELPDGRLTGSIQFADTEDGAELLELYRSGAMSACSIGWLVADATRSTDPARGYGALDIVRAELTELSLVAVPSDENALVVGRGLSTTKRTTDRSRVYAQAREALRFKGFGEQLRSIYAYRASGVEDARLQRAPLGNNELDPSGGGFLVASQFVDQLVGSIYEQSVIAPLVQKITTETPLASIKIPAVDETSRADGSRWGGATSYWAAEAATISPSFPRFRQIEFSPKKVVALVYASEELFEDAAMLESHLTRALASELSFKLDAAIFNGTAGQPLGVLNSPALITVPKVSGQASGTIVKENLNAMWSRLPAPSRRNAVWLVNEDAMAQIDVGVSEYQGVYGEPENGERFPRLKGAPVYEIEQASQLGTLGDIMLIDPTQYLLVGSDMKTAVSADIQFLTHQIAFRFTMRVDGSPLWASPITPYNGTSTRSPFITLAAR